MSGKRLMQICTEIEKKAEAVKEQQAEYNRVQAAYTQMVARLDGLERAKSHAEATQLDLEAEIQREAKKRL